MPLEATANPQALSRPFLLGVALIAGAILLVELAFTRIFSVTMFYHFAFLAISLAMFGTSASGVFIYVTPGLHRPARHWGQLQTYALLFAATTVVSTVVLLRMRLEMTYSLANLGRMIFVYLLAATPFWAGGACLALAVSRAGADVHRVYAADLLGAAAGCLLVIPAMELLGGPGALLAAALLGTVAALCFSLAGPSSRQWACAVAVAGVAGAVLVQARAPFLDVVFAKGEAPRPTEFSKWNSFSRVAVYPQEHQDWALSDSYRGPLPQSRLMDIDGSASTPILLCQGSESADYLRYELTALGHHLLPKDGEVLVIGPGGGRDLWTALVFGAGRVDGVEINSIITRDVMSGRYRQASGDIYFQPGVSVTTDDGRSFIRRTDGVYDLIQASLVDTWAASSAGAFALSENNLYTVEAFVEYFKHLKPDGMLSVSRWVDDGLRVVSLAREAGRRAGFDNPADHLFIARHGRLATFLIKNTPFTGPELSRLQEAAQRLRFEVLYQPPAASATTPNNDFARLAETDNPASFYHQYPLDISPPTDDRPFFFHHIKPKDLPARFLAGGFLFGDGSGVLLNLLAVSLGLVALFIVMPLVLAPRRTQEAPTATQPSTALGAVWPLAYFASLGVGFMFVEFGLMQRFVLFLGHPVYALTITLFTLLFAGGLGSAASRRLTGGPRRSILLCVPAVAGAAALYALALPWLFDAAMAQGIAVRAIGAVVLLMPVGFLLGMPFPAGMRLVSERRPDITAWMWATNGSASVLGAVLAVLIALNAGFTVVLLLGCATYLGAWLCGTAMMREPRMRGPVAGEREKKASRMNALVGVTFASRLARAAVALLLLACGVAALTLAHVPPETPAAGDFFDTLLGAQQVPGVEERGFHGQEEAGGQAFRWTNGAARLVVPGHGQPRCLYLVLDINNPKGTHLRVFANRQALFDEHVPPQSRWTRTFDLDPAAFEPPLAIELLSDTFVPPSSKGPADDRALGVLVRHVTVVSSDRNYLDTVLGGAPVAGVDESGFHPQEEAGGQAFRWTTGAARLTVPLHGQAPRALDLVLDLNNSKGTKLRVAVNGRQLFDQHLRVQGNWLHTLDLSGTPPGNAMVIELHSDTFVPSRDRPDVRDDRTLGVMVRGVTLRGDSKAVAPSP